MTDTWDEMRAGTWELDTEALTTLLGLLGVAREPRAAQVEAVRRWSESPAYIPAPETLKEKIREFLEGG